MELEEKGREASPEIQAQPQGTRPTRGPGRGSSVALGSQTKQLQIGVTGAEAVPERPHHPSRSTANKVSVRPYGGLRPALPTLGGCREEYQPALPAVPATGSSLKEG